MVRIYAVLVPSFFGRWRDKDALFSYQRLFSAFLGVGTQEGCTRTLFVWTMSCRGVESFVRGILQGKREPHDDGLRSSFHLCNHENLSLSSQPILAAHTVHREPCEQQAASYHLISVYSSLLRPGALRVLLWRRVSRGPGILVGK